MVASDLTKFCFTTVYIEAFLKIFTRSGKMRDIRMWGSTQVPPNQVSKKFFYTFEDIDLRESHAKLQKLE